MSIRQLPSPRWTIPGNSGVVAAGYYVYTYQPGTSTPKATYTDHTGATPNTNPIVLDARGEANIWWDGQYKVLAYTGDKDAGGVLVWSQDNYGEGTSAVLQGNFNLVLNGSFEQDTNGDDLPDDWTIVEYTDGQVERDSLEQIHGSYSLKFTSVGTGGGYADSTLFEVQEARVLPVSFALKSSIATVHNQVDVVWYTAAGAVLSTTTLYDDATTNPTDWTTFNYSATPQTNARFGKIRIFGCKDDNAQPGSVWFDNVVSEAASIAGLFPNVNAEVTATDEELNYLDGAELSGWMLTAAKYQNVSFDLSSQAASPKSLKMSDDGLYMYVADSSRVVYQYTIGSAWDVSSASYVGDSLDVSGQLTALYSIAFSTDGTQLFCGGQDAGGGAIAQYTLSTAWDISTATYSGSTLSVAAQDSSPVGISFRSTGGVMHVLGAANAAVFQYSMTGFDISTASYATKSFSVSSQSPSPSNIFLNSTRRVAYVSDNNGMVFEYYALNSSDVTTWSYSGNKFIKDGLPQMSSAHFSSDGTRMYVIWEDAVRQYRTAVLVV